MFDPISTITATGWMLQTVTEGEQKQRAQALTSKGNEHAFRYHSEITTETANFTLGGSYTGNMTIPSLGGGITDWTVTYSEKDFPKLDVTKSSAAGGGTFACPLTLPARAIGCPTSIPGFTATGKTLPPCKTITIACTCQHVEETDGTGEYDPDNFSGMRDATITITLTGIDGRPTITAGTIDAGWDSPSGTKTNSNTAIGSGSVVYEKHFPIGTDTDASGGSSSGGGSST